jgi:CheY-like chemotaxis protein
LHQVLLNLCVNARDAMPDGGKLTITVDDVHLDKKIAGTYLDAKPGPYICLQVEDTGMGIPRDHLDKIFDPFFTTKEVGKGTGLGLSTSLSIVKGHQGFIRVSSRVGKGTRFRIYLPAQTSTFTEERKAESVDLPRGNGETILVVDDEASIRQITRQTLETFGYRVVLASDGAEAALLYAQSGEEISAVIMDMMMPIMDGPSAIQALIKLNPKVRIIAASGLNANANLSRAAEGGVKHFLTKPYNAETLLKVMEQVLSEKT